MPKGNSTLAIDSIGSLYVAADDYLYALNTVNNTLLWQYYGGAYTSFTHPIIGKGGIIYVSTANGLIALSN